MKTYTCTETGQRFIAQLNRNSLAFFSIGKTDPEIVLNVPEGLSGAAETAYRRSDAEGILRVAERCIDAECGLT